MKTFVKWLINELFGAHAREQFLAAVKAFVLQEIASNPAASKEAVVAAVVARSTSVVATVSHLVPAWGQAVLAKILTSEESTLVGEAYDEALAELEAAKASEAASGSSASAPAAA